jgi:MFS family permease
MQRSKQNVLLLSLCQALAMTGLTILGTTAGLIGQLLATDRSLATLPLALLMLATTLVTIPASLLMKRTGRRNGLAIGVLMGILGALLGVYSVFHESFPLFCLAIFLFGISNGFAGFYRFAAIDAATESFRAQAISLVLAGGVIAALVGPGLATRSQTWFSSSPFAGSLVSLIALGAIALLLLLGIDIPLASLKDRQEKGRPIKAIMQQPVAIVALLASTCGYAVMILIMSATPLAMVAMHHPFDMAASAIQWHVLGMFAPSFVTGFLIARFGVLNVILVGIILNLLSISVNLLGTDVWNFKIALLMLGIGWNFMFVGSTSLLVKAYTPAEKAKTQATQDFITFGFVTIATLGAGHLLHNFGWQAVNLACLPPLLLALTITLWFRYKISLAFVS